MTIEVGPSHSALSEWLQPIAPGKWGGASRLTGAALLMFPASLVLQVVAITLMGSSAGPIATLAFVVMAIAATGLLLSLPVAAALFVWDIVRAGKRQTVAANSPAPKEPHLNKPDRASALATVSTTRAALAEIYRRHHPALVAELKTILAPDKYHRRDVQAVARELSLFQDDVAERELLAQGHAPHLIHQAFEADKARLVRAILAEV